MQEDSLTQTEEQVKKDIYNGVEQYWEPLAEVKDLLAVYYDFIEYEYGVDDERNTLYLTEDKKIFHQLTGSAYDIVVAERNYYEVSAGIFIAGATELRYAEMWNRYPTPEYLDHNAKVVFGESVRDTVKHLMDEGKDKLGVWSSTTINLVYLDGLQSRLCKSCNGDFHWSMSIRFCNTKCTTGGFFGVSGSIWIAYFY